MRKPRTLLALVDAESLETAEEPLGEPTGFPSCVVENEHPDAPRLAIAPRRKRDLTRFTGGASEGGSDRGQLGRRAPSEEGERDVEMLARNDPAVAKIRGLPGRDAVEDVRG